MIWNYELSVQFGANLSIVDFCILLCISYETIQAQMKMVTLIQQTLIIQPKLKQDPTVVTVIFQAFP